MYFRIFLAKISTMLRSAMCRLLAHLLLLCLFIFDGRKVYTLKIQILAGLYSTVFILLLFYFVDDEWKFYSLGRINVCESMAVIAKLALIFHATLFIHV